MKEIIYIKRKFCRCIIVTALTLSAGLTTSCSDSEDIPQTNTSFNIITPEDVKNMSITSQTITLTNISTGEKTTVSELTNVKIMEGLYDCVYSADVTYTSENDDGETSTISGTISGTAEGIELTGNSKTVDIETYLFAENDDFIFEEIFFTGTLRASGSQYYGDGYFKIYNNTDHILYADGLAFCESRFRTSLYYEYSPDIRKDTMTIWSLYVIPGSGTDHPVLPGHSMTICDTGIDHRIANPNSFDLSNADFEWYDVSTQPSHTDIDSETVPNLDKWYCYTLSFYILHNSGNSSFALARIPIDKETYLRDYYYTYNYVMNLPAGTFYMQNSGYKMPNAWIVDGVNCAMETDRQWNILPPTIDGGWTYCARYLHDDERYFKSIRRKLLYLNADGTRKLKDTNNSTEDFNTLCTPSIIEAQHTAIDAAGTTATTETYDGVILKQ